MSLVLLIDATEFHVGESDAVWLAHAIRASSVDAAGQAWDPEADAALGIAEAITGQVERRSSREPVVVGRSAALGLLQVFQDGSAADVQAHVAKSEAIASVYLALRSYGLESVRQHRR